MIASGINPESDLVEIMELRDHPWYIGIQFHPEYSSTAMNSHPLFKSFIKAALDAKGDSEPAKQKKKQKAE
jgi:CTP synthase